MKPMHFPGAQNLTALAATLVKARAAGKAMAAVVRHFGMWSLLLFVAAGPSLTAQTVQFRAPQVRITVPINSTNVTSITNLATVANLTAPVNFDVSGLPAGASATLADTNGNTLTSTMETTNLVLTVNTTNIAEGVYTFSLNASGGATNNILFVLQAAHIWNGGIGVSNAVSIAANWQGGVPTPSSDVVFGDQGAQTNIFGGVPFTNCFVDVDATVASVRFSQTGLTNSIATDPAAPPRSHHVRINAGRTMTITGTNGLSLLRDYVDEFAGLGTMNVNISGGAGAKLVISNIAANISVLLGNQAQPTLNISNLETLVTHVSRLGLAEFQLYPNYRNYNDANDFGGNPRRFIANIYLARTNIIKAFYADADNYTNEFTRSYALGYQSSEVSGVGSSVNTFFYLGQSNAFFLDSVCFIRANHATGNGGAVRFNPNFASPTALFRGTNGGRMAVFTVSDDGGTNAASSNVKATIDFATGNGFVDILADRLYVARDRTLIASNQTPNVQGDLTFGRGTVDVNTVVLGFQEHDGKTNWTTIGGAQPYLNYCQGRLFVTNGGTFKVNGTLTLGYTADTNPSASAQQFNTYGQVTIFSNSTVAASNIVVDGGLNFYDSNGRANRITMSQATLIVSNSIGAAPGLPLDALSLDGSTLALHNVGPGRTNVYVRTLLTPGTTPSVIKIVSLSGVTSYPAQIPIISYESAASPFLTANVTNVGANFVAYVLDNTANKTVDVFITTNAPNNLIWTGNLNADWDTTTLNWVTAVGTIPTNFNIGDSVTFNDTSTRTNVNVVGSVVPGQAGTGVTVSNSSRNYTFSGGTIAGTALMVKQGTGKLTIDATKQGPITISAGNVEGTGTIGLATVASNALLNFSGTVNGGLTSTGQVAITSSGTVMGPVSLQGGWLASAGTVSTAPGTLTVVAGNITNSGAINVAGGTWAFPAGYFLANSGTITNLNGRLNLNGTMFGTGHLIDPDGGLVQNNVDGRLALNAGSLLSPGDALVNSIGTFHADCRLDLNVNVGVFSKVLIEVDFAHAQTNDMVASDRWNNMLGMLVMTNINPGAGIFGNGQSFQIFANNNGLSFPNTPDVAVQMPTISPAVPGPGLHWYLGNLKTNGVLSITNSLVWRGNVSGNWDITTANWAGSLTYSDGMGVLFDDSATGETNVNLTTTLAPATTNQLQNLAPGMIVSNALKQYTFAGPGRITGPSGLYKTGPGTLTIQATTNNYSGNTVIDGGTLVVTLLTNTSQPSSIGQPTLSGLSGGNLGAERLVIDGAVLKYLGGSTMADRAATFGAGGATINVASSSTLLNLTGMLLGPGSLTKAGPGTLTLSQANNNYAGGTIVSDGFLRVTASGAASTNTITLAGGALQFTNGGFTLNNPVNVAGTASRILTGSTNISGGAWSGSGAVTMTISNAGQFIFNTNLASFGGKIDLGASAGSLRFNNATNSNNCRGSSAATFDLGTGTATLNNLNGAGFTYDLGALAGGSDTVLYGSSTNVSSAGTTYSIGANGSNSVFYGRITNGLDTVSVTKVGSGLLALNGNNAYTGTTTVSAGTLGGTGVISGPVSVAVGGTLAPGASIGTLAINNTLTLAGTTTVEVSKSGSTLISDKITGLTSVTFGGSLVVSNLGPDTLAAGDSFPLFNIGGAANFTSIIAPPPASGLAWNFNPATGVLSVVSATAQPTLNFGRSGNNLQLSWTASGFKLQSQTNSVSVGINSNWADYPGAGASSATVPIDATQGTVFFRLAPAP